MDMVGDLGSGASAAGRSQADQPGLTDQTGFRIRPRIAATVL
jgi:hypothetical protein